MLFIILIICFVAIVSVCLTFFYSKDATVYGSRLDDIKKHPIKEKVEKGYKQSLKEKETIKKVSFTTKGRIVYIHLYFTDEIELDEAKLIAEDSLSLFSDDIKEYYDIEFMLQNSNFNIIGAKNSVSDHVSWNNNRIVEEEEPNEES